MSLDLLSIYILNFLIIIVMFSVLVFLAWFENKYNPRLLHSNLAFPLLKQLTDVGDPLASEVFKVELIKICKGGDFFFHWFPLSLIGI